jgi:8-oxo-dGTP pyrophosphatase MutT (NUDIX family)
MTHRAFKRKVLAYITQGDRLLVFRQPDYLSWGIQVPGGGIEPGEDHDLAVLREVFEETGLREVAIVSYLGSLFTARPEHMRELHCYHLAVTQPTPERWRHYEMHSTSRVGPIAFDFFWVPIQNPGITLYRGHEMISRLPQPILI